MQPLRILKRNSPHSSVTSTRVLKTSSQPRAVSWEKLVAAQFGQSLWQILQNIKSSTSHTHNLEARESVCAGTPSIMGLFMFEARANIKKISLPFLAGPDRPPEKNGRSNWAKWLITVRLFWCCSRRGLKTRQIPLNYIETQICMRCWGILAWVDAEGSRRDQPASSECEQNAWCIDWLHWSE